MKTLIRVVLLAGLVAFQANADTARFMLANPGAAPGFDVNTGAGTQVVAGCSMRKAASGGSAEYGTSSDPLRIDPTGTTTQPVSLSGNQAVNVAQINGVTPLMGNGVTGTGSHRVTISSDNTAFTVNAAQSGTWNINNVSGTVSLPTGAATEASLAKLTVAQGAALGTNTQALAGASVTTGAPTYTTGQISPFSLNTSGGLRVDGSGVTQPVSGTVTANQGGAPWSENVSQINGVTPLMGNGVTGTGSLRVTMASDTTAFTVNAAQSGTWNVTNVSGTVSLPTGASTAAKQPALGTAGAASADVITVQGAAGMTAVKVDGSAVTQPVSLAGTQAVNVSQINGVTPLMGNGVAGTGSHRVTIASDNTAFSVNTSTTQKTTYSASAVALAPAASATDIFTLTGSGTKTVKITRVQISGIATAAGAYDVVFLKRSTANSAGTSSDLTEVPYDSNDAAATATALSYTANPTTGTLVGNLQAKKITVSTAGGAIPIIPTELTFDERAGERPIVLRGTGQVFAINLNGVTVTGGSLTLDVTWTEE